MADTYEKDLGQKTSLTTSDFIRVVGSDNVSYKQALTSVLDTFNTNLPIRQLSASSFANLDTQLSAISADIWYFATVNGTDGPNTRNRWTVIGFNNATSTYAFQWAMTFNGNLYERRKSNSSTWSAWVTQPTRAEVDALTSKASLTFGIPATGSTFTVPNNYRGRLTIVTSNSAYCGEYLLFATGAGVVETVAVKSASGITLSTATNAVTLTPTSGTRDVLFETISATPVTKQ